MKHPTLPLRATTALALAGALLLAACAGSGSTAKADVPAANVAPEKPAPPDTVREYNDKGVLVEEIFFPKSARFFYDDGTPKVESVGELYRDSAGTIRMANGTFKGYFPNGQLAELTEWANKAPVSTVHWRDNGSLIDSLRGDGSGAVFEKKWNEKGILIAETRFPDFRRRYYDDGSPEFELEGELYREGPADLELENGRERQWHWNGQLSSFTTIRDRKLVAKEEWFENGALKAKINLDSGRCELFRPDGSPKGELVGSVYVDIAEEAAQLRQPICKLIDGVGKTWHENGQLQSQTVWKGKTAQSQEEWNENGRKTAEYRADAPGRTILKEWSDNGVLTFELAAPDSIKTFSPKTGKPIVEIRGTVVKPENGSWELRDGTANLFDEEGKLFRVLVYKDGLVRSAEFPSIGAAIELRRDSLDNLREARIVLNGKIIKTATGFLNEIEFNLSEDEYALTVKTGEMTKFFPGGRENRRETFRKDKLVSMQEWHENGKLAKEADLTSYREWREDGTLRLEATGTIVWENGEFQLKDGKLRLVGPDGKTTEHVSEYRDFNPVSK